MNSKLIENNKRINWVLINELAIGPKPSTDEIILQLKEFKIKSILSLCSKEEFQLNNELITTYNCSRVVLPDHNYKRKLESHELKNAFNELKVLMGLGSVFVHCVAGIERSPLLCMAWLIKEKKLSKSNALEYMMRANPGTNPLTQQLSILDSLN